VRLPELLRTSTFRWTLGISAAFTALVVLMFVYVYWHTNALAVGVADRLNEEEANRIASLAPDRVLEEINRDLDRDPLRTKLVGLFDSAGNRIAGNIESLPPGSDRDADTAIIRVDAQGREQTSVRLVARRLADNNTLLVARDYAGLTGFAGTLSRSLALGLIPALCLALAAGTFLSLRTQKRIAEVTSRIQRVVAGDFHERLPSKGGNDPFERLAVQVNGMLDEIERLVENLGSVGNDIAHDLRTPLTRVRVGLERARNKAGGEHEFKAAIDQAIVGLDQSLAIVTALLRIAEIEHSRRLAGFRDVALTHIVREIGELYEPIAEDKHIHLAVVGTENTIVHGDRDLLFEAIANLVDNAVKFTPDGGHVELNLSQKGDEAFVRVSDSGAGIALAEQDLVTRRFYRSDRSRRDPGLGLGLSLVSAIVKLHGFRFNISSGPGCVVEIVARRVDAAP
jgi:signal transduction histidine kinase